MNPEATMTRRTAAHWGSYLVERAADGTPRLVDDPQDPEPSVIGHGWLSAMQDGKVRIARPAIREGWLEGDRGAGRGDDGYVEMSWDEALEHVARELDRVRHAHGNGAIFAGSYGWASAGRFHHAQSQMRRFLNLIGGHVFARDTYSHAAAEVLLPHVTGMSHRRFSSQMTTWARIAENCRLFLAVGGVSARTAQISSGGTARHETDTWLNRAAAEWIAALRPRALAVDFPQDYPIRLLLDGIAVPDEEHVTHDVLLRQGVTLIEYVANTAALSASRVLLSAAPLKIENADGAPARAYAIEGLL